MVDSQDAEWMFDIEFKTNENPEKIVRVYVGEPKLYQEGHWRCRNFIEGILDEKTAYASGGNPFQALIMTMVRVRKVLEAQTEEYFHSDVEMRTILPLYTPISYGLEFQDEIEAMIQKRVDEEEQRLTDKFSKKYPEHYKDVLDKNDGKKKDKDKK